MKNVAAFDVNLVGVVQRFEFAVHDFVKLFLKGPHRRVFLNSENYEGALWNVVRLAVDRYRDFFFCCGSRVHRRSPPACLFANPLGGSSWEPIPLCGGFASYVKQYLCFKAKNGIDYLTLNALNC